MSKSQMYICTECEGREGYLNPCKYTTCSDVGIKALPNTCPWSGDCKWKLFKKAKR